MIVYVESNFVLHLVQQQEALPEVRLLLDMARNKTIDLAIPALGLIEPNWTIRHREIQRQQLVQEMGRQVREVRRSSTQQHAAQAISDAVDQFQNLDVLERESFDEVLMEMTGVARVIPIGASTIQLALIDQYHRDLSFLDSVVWACVRQDLEAHTGAGQKVFATSDRTAFNKPEIKVELGALSCKVVTTFKQAVDVVHSITKSEPA